MLGLDELLDRRPAALSGGQRQRVAMGRAIVREPKAFLMDEPLSNLDAKLRVSMRAQLASLHARLGTTTIYVTHDQVEAMTLGQRVAVMRDGRILQVDTPQLLYANPRNLFVAAFIGSPAMNLVEAAISDGTIEFAGFRIPLAAQNRPAGSSRPRVVVGIRPEAFEDAALADPSLPQIDVPVDVGPGEPKLTGCRDGVPQRTYRAQPQRHRRARGARCRSVPGLQCDRVRAAGQHPERVGDPPPGARRAGRWARLGGARPGGSVAGFGDRHQRLLTVLS